MGLTDKLNFHFLLVDGNFLLYYFNIISSLYDFMINVLIRNELELLNGKIDLFYFMVSPYIYILNFLLHFKTQYGINYNKQ